MNMKGSLVTVLLLTVLELVLCTSRNSQPKYNKRRSLRMGDTFTVREMLPIAERLMKKVSNLGGGKGIVSSAFHPHDLTDRLFEAYFLTGNRSLTLKGVDIAGLDAFQALALCGDEVKVYNEYESITESPNNRNGEHTIDDVPIKCLYKLLSKPVENNDTAPDLPDTATGASVQPQEAIQKVAVSKVGETLKPIVSNRRFSIREQANKKLGKKRKLIIKTRRHGSTQNTEENKFNLSTKETNNNNKTSEKQKIESTTSAGLTKFTKVNEGCRWRYQCTVPADQRTCRVSTDCTMKEHDKCFGDKDVENTKTMQNFRRMIGIDPIDEEVEKILERHVIQVRSYVKDVLELESMKKYFNSLKAKDSKKATMGTTAMPKRK